PPGPGLAAPPRSAPPAFGFATLGTSRKSPAGQRLHSPLSGASHEPSASLQRQRSGTTEHPTPCDMHTQWPGIVATETVSDKGLRSWLPVIRSARRARQGSYFAFHANVSNG